MKTRYLLIPILALLSAFSLQPSAFAQGTAFTYQGRLNDGGSTANGKYDLRFAIYDALANGNPVGGAVTNAATTVTNGLLTVTLDFGASVFTGSPRWLEIGVRTNGGASFATLAPRQAITAAPYAIEAASAAQLQQVPISTIAPASGQVLSFSGTQWQPAAVPTPPLPALGGDLTGTLSAASVGGLRGVPINSVAPASGQVLTFSGTQWQPAAVPTPPLPALGGDLTGTLSAASVGGLRGVPINSVAPASGQVLTYSGTQWQPVGLPAIPGPGSAVTAENFGAAGSVGTGTTYARADHLHAMPSLPADLARTTQTNTFSGSQVVLNGSLGVGVSSPLHTVHVGSTLGVASINSAARKMVVEDSNANGRAVLLALAGPGSSTAANRVELQIEASDGEHRAIIGTSSAHEVEFRMNNSEVMTLAANGNVGIGNSSPQQKLHVIGNILASGTITPNSDRNAKTGFAPIDTAAVLEKVAHLPIQQWRFKAEAEEVKHVGPMAQDFRAAFGLGEIPTAIATVDADGVALAAIQGLNQKVDERGKEFEARSRKLEAENAELKQKLAELRKMMQELSGKLSGGGQ